VIAGVLFALVRAHGLGVAHGALRPGCVFLDADHRPIVGGFGAPPRERAADPAAARFCAPETPPSESADARGDVFAFSLIVYAVAAESPRATAAEAAARLLRGKREGLPEPLAALVAGGLSPDPGERPSAAQFLRDFEERKFAILAGADAAAVAAFAAWADETDPRP
jgi:hypothetical protein